MVFRVGQHGLGGHIISDGGCTCPGDVAKAFGGGADFVMLGGMLAGHDECLGEVPAPARPAGGALSYTTPPALALAVHRVAASQLCRKHTARSAGGT